MTGMLLATIIDIGALLKTAAAALVSGVGVTLAFSLAIYGGARFVDLRHDERGLAATAAAVLTFVGLAVSLAAVVAGITVMLE